MTRQALFVCGVGERYKLTYLISREIEQRKSIHAYYLIINNNMRRYLSQNGVEENRIIDIKPAIRSIVNERRSININELKNYEGKYGIPTLSLFWEGMRGDKGYSYFDFLNRFGAIFKVIEDLFYMHDFDFAFMDTIVASVMTMVLLTVFEKNKKPFYYLFSSKLPGRFVISRGLQDHHLSVENAFIKIKERDLSNEERLFVNSFLKEFREGKNVHRIQDEKIRRKKVLNGDRLKRSLYSLYEGYRFRTYKGMLRQHSGTGPILDLFRRLISYIRADIYRQCHLFKKPNYNQKYVLFFLHKQPEASTFVKAPFFLNQHAIVENISKSLPVDVMLYIKPHYNDFGGKPLRYYRDFLCRPNIRLINVDEDGKKLIYHSLGVITITGTVGWEGLLLGKPVISMGHMFYNIFDQIIHLTDLTRLPEVINIALSTYHLDEELLKKFVMAMFQGSHRGNVFSPPLHRDVLRKENIQDIVNGLENEGIFNQCIPN